jgi:peptidyl-prolyl cis-trans isomerase C
VFPLIVLLCAVSACQRTAAPDAAASQPAAAATAATAAPGIPSQSSQAVPPAGQPAAPGLPGQAPGSPEVKPVPAQLPDVLARVNGEAIGKAEFERALKNLEARAGRAVPAERRDEILRGVLDQLVVFHVLMQETKARQIAVTEADLSARVGELQKQFPSEDEFKKALASRGMTLDDLKQETRQELALSRLVEAEVKPQIKVAESDVKDFYDKNPDRFKQPEAVRASHILLRVEPTATAEQKQQARAKIDDLLKQVKAGGDFAALARQHSQDGSAPQGGDLNYFPRGQMVPPFEQAAFALQPGQVSDVVETQFGYHIIKVTDRRPRRASGSS